MLRIPRENQSLENFLLGAVAAVCFVLVAVVLRLGRASLQSIDLWEARLRERRSMRHWLMRRGWTARTRRF